MTQTQKILQHLRDHGSITSMEAYERFGCTRLSARIKDLRDEGHSIASDWETAKNRDGVTISFARYRLAEKKGA